MQSTKILVVEDNEDINRILSRYLERDGYRVVSAYSGTEARLLLKAESYDLILLDLMLPGVIGEELISEIRTASQVPIIVISAKIGLSDKVNALKTGADDYITKPFERDEVLARVSALLRRSRTNQQDRSEAEEELIRYKNITLKPQSHSVYINDNKLELTAFEFDILHLLMKNPDKVFTKDQLYQLVWKTGYYGEDNTINVHISNIRKKIKELDDEVYIKTVWGIGFKLEDD